MARHTFPASPPQPAPRRRAGAPFARAVLEAGVLLFFVYVAASLILTAQQQG